VLASRDWAVLKRLCYPTNAGSLAYYSGTDVPSAEAMRQKAAEAAIPFHFVRLAHRGLDAIAPHLAAPHEAAAVASAEPPPIILLEQH
jgi:hypothetical protein